MNQPKKIGRLKRTRNQQMLDAALARDGYSGDWFAYATQAYEGSEGDYQAVQRAFAKYGVRVHVNQIRNWMTSRRNYEARLARQNAA